uniref:STAS domain-containing protein n=1 Tax=Acrobeloides nanus TaxID=290746 RepID=A0A914E1R5_9BILA
MGVLSAIIIVAIKGMLEKFKDLHNLWPVSKIDFSIWLVSFLATFCWDVTEGLAVSIMFAIMTTVFRTQWPKWHLLANLSGINEYRDERRYQNVIRNKGIYIFHFDSPLVFTNVEYFKTCIYKALENLQNECSDHDKDVDVIENMKEKDPNIELAKETSLEDNEVEKLKNNLKLNENLQYFIFDCSGITYVDYMGINAIKEMFIELKTRNIIVYFSGIKDHVRDIFEASNSYKIIPKSSFFPAIQDAVATAKASQHV